MSTDLKSKYVALKAALNLNDQDVSEMFGYTNRASFANSSRRDKVLTGMVEIAERLGFDFESGQTKATAALSEIVGLANHTLIGNDVSQGKAPEEAYKMGANAGFNACANIAADALGVDLADLEADPKPENATTDV